MKIRAALPIVLTYLALLSLLSASTTITVGTSPIYSAVNSTTNRIYVSNSNSKSLSVIDGITNTVIATVELSAGASGVDVNPTTNMVYVASGGSIVVIDGNTNAIVATVTGVFPIQLAVNSATNLIYVPNYSSQFNSVSVIDGGTNTITATIPVGNTPGAAAVNPVANLIYISNQRSGTISVIDGATNTVTNTFILPPNALAGNLALDTKSNRLYVMDGGSRLVYVVNASSGKLVKVKGGTIPFVEPSYAAVLQPGKTVLISDQAVVWPLNESTNVVGAALTGLSEPTGIAVNQVTRKIYVSNTGSNTVSVFSY